MGQHRAALKAKARRAKADYWRKMRPFIVLFAEVIGAVRRARIRRVAAIWGDYIRWRLNQPSFAELILPVVSAETDVGCPAEEDEEQEEDEEDGDNDRDDLLRLRVEGDVVDDVEDQTGDHYNDQQRDE